MVPKKKIWEKKNDEAKWDRIETLNESGYKLFRSSLFYFFATFS